MGRGVPPCLNPCRQGISDLMWGRRRMSSDWGSIFFLRTGSTDNRENSLGSGSSQKRQTPGLGSLCPNQEAVPWAFSPALADRSSTI